MFAFPWCSLTQGTNANHLKSSQLVRFCVTTPVGVREGILPKGSRATLTWLLSHVAAQHPDTNSRPTYHCSCP